MCECYTRFLKVDSINIIIFDQLFICQKFNFLSMHKRNFISKIRPFISMNEIKARRKCMVVLKFLENIEEAVASPLALSKLRL